MPSGPENKPEEKQMVVLSPEEFNAVVKRVHEFLLFRTEKARAKKEAKPSDRAESKHLEAAKDVFVFVHMLELIEHMAAEIADLRGMLAAMGVENQEVELPEMFAVAKKTGYLN